MRSMRSNATRALLLAAVLALTACTPAAAPVPLQPLATTVPTDPPAAAPRTLLLCPRIPRRQ